MTAKNLYPNVKKMVAEDSHLMTETSTLAASAAGKAQTFPGKPYRQ